MKILIWLIVFAALIFSDLPINLFTIFLALIAIFFLGFLDDLINFSLLRPLEKFLNKFSDKK